MCDRTTGARATILAVEDDLGCARLLKELLEDRGYSVWHAAGGTEAEQVVGNVRPDLILLDLILPDACGLVLCAELKAKVDVPIIICSATKRKEDSVLALKLGADDFVAKPFSPGELLARVEAALRRAVPRQRTEPSSLAPVRLRISNLVIDQARCQVMLGDEVVRLTPTEYRLLCALASRPDEVVTREELSHSVWGYHDLDVSHSLDVHMRRLRAKLQACALLAPMVVTVRGFGYRITSAPEKSLPRWAVEFPDVTREGLRDGITPQPVRYEPSGPLARSLANCVRVPVHPASGTLPPAC